MKALNFLRCPKCEREFDSLVTFSVTPIPSKLDSVCAECHAKKMRHEFVSLVGIVYYASDPPDPNDGQVHHKTGEIVRVIYPEYDDAELDGPPTDGERRVHLRENGNWHTWLTLGMDTARKVVLEKVKPNDPRLKASFVGDSGAFTFNK
jgi:hypothetical protein